MTPPLPWLGLSPTFLAPLCILAMGELQGAECCPPTLLWLLGPSYLQGSAQPFQILVEK